MSFFLTVLSCMECSSACPWGAHCKKRLWELNTLYTLIDAECAPCILCTVVYTQIELPRKQHEHFILLLKFNKPTFISFFQVKIKHIYLQDTNFLQINKNLSSISSFFFFLHSITYSYIIPKTKGFLQIRRDICNILWSALSMTAKILVRGSALSRIALSQPKIQQIHKQFPNSFTVDSE